MTLKILAYGANGAQMVGGTHALAEAGHEVTAFTRSEQGAARWKAAGVKTLIGDLSDEAVLHDASQGQDALFLHVPLFSDSNADRAAFGLNALKAAKAAGVTRVVWNTGGPIMDPASTTDPAAILLRAL